MSEARVVLALAVTAAALTVAAAARVWQRRRAALAPLRLDGLPSGLVLFSDSACRRCAGARALLLASEAAFTEVAHDREPERFRSAGVTAVPLLVAIRPGGGEVGRVVGRVTPRALRSLQSRLG